MNSFGDKGFLGGVESSVAFFPVLVLFMGCEELDSEVIIMGDWSLLRFGVGFEAIGVVGFSSSLAIDS